MYSFVFMAFGYSNLVPFFLIKYKISYMICFIVSALFTILSSILMLFVKDRYYILIDKK